MIRLIASLFLFAACSIPAAMAESRSVTIGEFQRGFMEVLYDYAGRYPKAENELQKSALVTQRSKSFQKLKGDPRAIKDWIGVLTEMKTTSKGQAYIAVTLPKSPFKVSTWNNEISDHQDGTLIPQSSPLYSKLAEMKVGNVVQFSGRLKRTKNMLEADRMTRPDFVFVFTDIKKIGDSIN